MICRNKSHALLNITFLHKFYIELDQEYKKLVLTEKVTNDCYVEKDCLEKEGKCPLNIACMLIFHIQNASSISQNLI